MEENFFQEVRRGHRPLTASLGEGEIELSESKENIIPNERTAFLLLPFFIEMIGQFIETLKMLGNHTRNVQEKLSGMELGAYLNRMITEDIQKIELLQNSLLNYIKVNNPVVKTDTVAAVLEEELKKYRVELEQKKIKLFKTLEKGLPEAAVPDDHLRYILGSLLQYVLVTILPNGTFGLFTRTPASQKEAAEGQVLDKKGEKHIEILMVYTGPKNPTDTFRTAFGIHPHQEEGMSDLALRLIDVIVKRNRGTMKLEVDEKNAKTSISLRFPLERRKVIDYGAAAELSSNVRPFQSTFERLSALEGVGKKG